MAATPWHNRIVGTGEESPDQLLANPRNYRVHTAFQNQVVQGSLDELGWIRRVLVNQRTGHIIDGHLRVTLALKRGEPVPIDYVDLSDEEEALALAVIDPTAALAGQDDALLRDLMAEVNTDNEHILAMLAQMLGDEPEIPEGLTDPDAVPEPPSEPITKPGDLWRLGRHRLLCGDSTVITDVERLMGGERAKLLVTDPPYGIGADTHAGKKENGWTQYNSSGWDADRPDSGWWSIGQSLTDYQIVWGGNYFTDLLPISQGWLVWDKGQRDFSLADGELAWTSFDRALRIATISRAAALKDGKQHPTQKSVELIDWCLSCADRNAGEFIDSVLDLFAGAGTTIVACEQTDRTCYGMEISPAYCDVIINRWEAFTGQTAERITDESTAHAA